MATKNIGFVVELTGSAEVRSAEGIIKVLSQGDKIYEGDVLKTAINTEIVLEFFNGQQLVIGENTEILMDETVFAGLEPYTDDRVDQLAELQQLIVDGLDLSELADTAAGQSSDDVAALRATSIYTRDGSEGSIDTQATPFQTDSSEPTRTDTFGITQAGVTGPVAPTSSIFIDPITADGVINAAEAAGTINVTGSVGGEAGPGDSISLVVNGVDYAGTVNDDGSFSVPVAGSDLVADTSFDVTVTGYDPDGNPISTTISTGNSTHTVDLSAEASISIDPVTADGIINAIESAGSIAVTGLVSGDAAPGDSVTVTVNGTIYSGVVLSGNVFSIDVAGTDLVAQNSFTVSVTGTDDAGNPFSASTTSTPHSVDLIAAATISVDAITADDIVNASEASGMVNVTGSVGGDAGIGDLVSFTINSTAYSGNVLAGNIFSIAVAGADLVAQTSFDATVVGSDAAGNPFVATTSSSHSVDTVTTATIDVNPITSDNVINAAESGTKITVSGSVGGDATQGDSVSFTVNDKVYSSTVLADSTYSVEVAGSDLVAQNSFDVTVTGADPAGNIFSATTSSTYGVVLSSTVSITVDVITADDIVNAAEAGGSITVTGSVTGDATVGDTVSFTLNGTAYSGTVTAGNTFSIPVSGADLAAQSTFDATVVGSDAAGNPFTASTTSTHTVDLVAVASITVDPITTDDIVNAAEAGGSINVTGSVAGDATIGDSVSFTLNGTPYSGTILAGNIFSIPVSGADLAAQTSFTATVVKDDAAGNPFSASTTSTHGVDLVAAASITVDPITADDIVNAAEAGGSITVTGSVGGDATIGDSVSFTLNGTAYSGTVTAGNTFSIPVSGADLAGQTTFDATVVGSDAAGNPFSATTTSTHTVDTTATASNIVDAITADDIVNAAEAGGSITVTGSVGGDATIGDSVSFTLNGTPYSGTILAGNTFSIPVAGSDLAAQTSFTATVTGSDAAGNPFSATTTSTHTVDITAVASITVDAITADDIVNAAEAGGSITVTGSVGGDATIGDSVSFTLNGTAYSGTVTAGNTFSIPVSGADLAAQTTFDATVVGSDAAGNPFTASTTSTHTVDLVAAASIIVDPITTDDIVNA
ncbi:MAG: retention module-containing protein, partial [Gammaproteobacteria bacterium]|nr:retention module-containing protein [Gammaproteobacteria bacterium]